MAVTGTKTVNDIVTYALRKASVTAWGETPATEDATAAMAELDLMLKGWQNKGFNLWTKTGGSLALTTAASYTLSPVRPLRILSARLKRSGTETPMYEMSRQEYDDLPNKASTGLPTQFYYDRQREAAKMYIWPVLTTVAGETIEYTYERELEDIVSLNDVIDVPGEWWDAVVHNLAVRMVETLGFNKPPTLLMRAAETLREAGAFDREESVYFVGDEWRY